MDIRAVANDIASGKTLVFCGAGISFNSGLPIVRQLLPCLLEKLGMPPSDMPLLLGPGCDAMRLPFEAFMQVLDDNSRMDSLYSIYDAGSPNTTHLLIAKLVKAGCVNTIVTTNFDRLIEGALAMEPQPMVEGKQYDLLHKVEDFEGMRWEGERVRLIKIHGSTHDKDNMAASMRQVARRRCVHSRDRIVDYVFSAGPHESVLMLGYSCSDAFDITPRIERMTGSLKKVYLVEHSAESRDEDLTARQLHNPFGRFSGSRRMLCDTDLLVKELWTSVLSDDYVPPARTETGWRANVDQWFRTAEESCKAITSVILGKLLLEISEFHTAAEYLGRAVRVAGETGDRRVEAISLEHVGICRSAVGEYEEAISLWERALSIAREVEDRHAEQRSLGNLGAALNGLGRYREAAECLSNAIRVCTTSGNSDDLGTHVGNLGIAHRRLGQYEQALGCFVQAYGIFRDSGDKHAEGAHLGNIGNTQRCLGYLQQAVASLEQALLIARELGDKQGEAKRLGNLGITYSSLEEPRKAIEYHQQALEVFRAIHDDEGQAYELCNLGNAYNILGKIPEAVDYYERSLCLLKAVLGDGHPTTEMARLNLERNRMRLRPGI